MCNSFFKNTSHEFKRCFAEEDDFPSPVLASTHKLPHPTRRFSLAPSTQMSKPLITTAYIGPLVAGKMVDVLGFEPRCCSGLPSASTCVSSHFLLPLAGRSRVFFQRPPVNRLSASPRWMSLPRHPLGVCRRSVVEHPLLDKLRGQRRAAIKQRRGAPARRKELRCRLFRCGQLFTRPTDQPRHAACDLHLPVDTSSRP